MEGNVLNRKGSGGRLFYPKNISRAPPHKYEGGTIMSFVKLRLQYHTATSIPHKYLMGSMISFGMNTVTYNFYTIIDL